MGVGGIGQTSVRSGLNWWELFEKQAGLVRIRFGAGDTGWNSDGSVLVWLQFFLILVKILLSMGVIGWNSFWRGQHWVDFFLERA